MDKIKRLINVVVPTTVCNFKCHYCYLSQENAFCKDVPKLDFDLKTIKQALTVERLGGICLMNVCAVGETLLAPYLYDFVTDMLDNGHYVTIVTNGSIKSVISKFCSINEDLKKRLFFKFSYHYLQLINNKMLDTFFDNIEMVKKSDISFTVELTANDESIEHIEKIKNVCEERLGAMPHIIESRHNLKDYKKLTNLSNKKHMKEWGKIDSPLIKFQDSVWGKKRTEFCYAGDWELNLYLQSGNITTCFAGGPVIQNIFENVEEPIHYRAIGNKCPWSHCFASHVLLTFGVIPDLNTPTYEEMRNRKTNDGDEWLKPEIKSFFSSKLIDSNKLYSDDKKCVTNWINGLILTGNSYEDNIKHSLERILLNNKIKNVGIINSDRFSNEFLQIIKDTRINIKFALNLEHSIIKNKFRSISVHKFKYIYNKIKFVNIPNMYIYDKLPSIDAIIVLDINEYLKAKTMLKGIVNKPIILLTDLN